VNRNLLITEAARQGIRLSDLQLDKFQRYAEILGEWNKKVNLTAITAIDEVVCKHFVDSLTVLPLLPAGKCSLIDVGSGAGFPGVPLAIMRGDLTLTALDSLNKRLIFLQELCNDLEIGIVTVHDRAEEAARRKQYRGMYDVATARAVAALPVLCEYCLPLVRVGGHMIAMKGPDGDREADAAANAIKLLGGQLGKIEQITLDSGDGEQMERRLIRIDKIAETSDVYPRHGAKITAKPL